MTSIIRNCVHSNDIYTGISSNPTGNPELITRATFSRKGVERIKREIEGITKYCQSIKIHPDQEIIKKHLGERYGFLHLKFHQGSSGNYFSSLKNNKLKFENLINYYHSKIKDFSHGDLSLGNIVFDGEKVEWIFDWENYNTILPLEYDLLYAVAENCLFLFEKEQLKKEDIHIFWDLIEKIEERFTISKKFKIAPSIWLRNTVIDYMEKSGVDHRKCPFACKSIRFLNQLDLNLKSSF